MPTKREKRTRNQRVGVSDIAADHWRHGRLQDLHDELRLKPWECSPLWCRSLWFSGGEPCSKEEHRGCHRAKAIRDELIRLTEHVPEVDRND